MRFIESDLIGEQKDYSFKGTCIWSRSYLTGFEVWLTRKLRFKVEIFTVTQKECLRLKRPAEAFRMGSQVVGNKEFIEMIRNEVPHES